MRAAFLLGWALVMLLVPTEVAQSQWEDRTVSTARQADPWVPISVPPTYAGYWAENIVCLDRIYGPGGAGSGAKRPTPFTTFDRLTVFVAGDSIFYDRRGRPVYGEFFPPDTIVVAGRFLFHPKLVRHEMMHAQGVMGHSVIPFVACGLWSGSLMEVWHP